MSYRLLAKAFSDVRTNAAAATDAIEKNIAAIDALPTKLPELSAGLAQLMGFADAQGQPFNATFDKAGKFQGGAFSDKYAQQLVTAFADFLDSTDFSFAELQRRGINPADVEDEKKKDIAYFAESFGNRYKKDLLDLANELRAYRKAATAQQDSNGFSPAGETAVVKTVTDVVAKATGNIGVQLGGYLAKLAETAAKLERERQALERERQRGTTPTTATRTPIPPTPAPSPSLTILRMSGALP